MLFTLDVRSRIISNPQLFFSNVIVAIWTGLSRNLDAEATAAIGKTSPFWKSLDQGAATVLVAALDPALNGTWDSLTFLEDNVGADVWLDSKGILLHDCQMTEAMPYATDPKLAEKLWTLSEKLVQTNLKL